MDKDTKQNTNVPFLQMIRDRMKKIELEITPQERLQYQPKIDYIYRLLDLFEETGAVSNEVKKALDKATDAIKKAVDTDKLITTRTMTPTKPTIDNLDIDTIHKAKMTKASSIFLETGNEDAVNAMLEPTGYKMDSELSTDEGLVLTNAEGEVKVAFRGTSTSFKRPLESVKDILQDGRIATGTESYSPDGGSLQSGRDLINSAMDKYGKTPEELELVGYSLGGGKSLLLGDEFGLRPSTH